MRLSRKSVVWKKFTDTKPAAKFRASGDEGGEISPRGEPLQGRTSPQRRATGIDLGGHDLLVQPARILRLPNHQVPGRRSDGQPVNETWIGIWAPALGSYHLIDAYNSWKRAGTWYDTYSTSSPGDTHIRTQQHAWGSCWSPVHTASESTFDADTVKVKVVYAVWAH